jgi:DNA polymerase-1
MRMNPKTKDAIKLFMEGAEVLASMSQNGIAVDLKYIANIKQVMEKKRSDMLVDFEKTPLYKEWKKEYKNEINLSSTEQLSNVLYNKLDFTCTEFTAKGRPQVTSEVLTSLQDDDIDMLLSIKSLDTAKNSFLTGFIGEQVDGVIHPFFSLLEAVTYRSASQSPNFQNVPVRNKELSEILRRCFVASAKDRFICEMDFSGIEVGVGLCYHHDRTMCAYLFDETKDMHRDASCDCYLLTPKQVTKDIRYCGKNKFVFPEFYGSYYAQCAPALWKAVDKMKLKTADGVMLYEHLSHKGIEDYETFLRHVRKVEDRFWNVRFKEYTEWKNKFFNRYTERGYIHTLTGFTCQGLMRRNKVINYPIQGTAFHILLQTAILVHKRLKRYNMQTRLIGQIHDSLVADVKSEEREVYYTLLQDCVETVMNKWDWIVCPLGVEIEATPDGASWFEKKPAHTFKITPPRERINW